MKRFLVKLMSVSLILLLLPAYHGLSQENAATEPSYMSPSVVRSDNERYLYAIGKTAAELVQLDLVTEEIVRVLDLPTTEANGIVLCPTGLLAFVTAGASTGNVFIVDLEEFVIKETIPVGHTPTSPVLSPDGNSLYVANRFTNDISVVDLNTRVETGRIKVLREPISIAVTPDGSHLFVANHLPVGPNTGSQIAAQVSVIDLETETIVNNIQLPNGSTSVRELVMSGDGQYAYLTHTLGRYWLPATRVDRGWMYTNGFSVIDVETQELVNTVLLDTSELGAATPWGITISEDDQKLIITHAGTHEISVIDRSQLHHRLNIYAEGRLEEQKYAAWMSPIEIYNDFNFLTGIRDRIRLQGNGPRSVTMVGNTIYVAEFFSDTIGVVEIDDNQKYSTRSIALTEEVPMSIERQGMMYFNDATVTFQNWLSCGSCHPDARGDHLNWTFLDGGIPNSDTTRTVVVGGLIPLEDLPAASSLHSIAFRGGEDVEEMALAINSYLLWEKPVESPYLEDGELSLSALRGKEVFEGEAQCISCHSGALFTDFKSHNIGTGEDRVGVENPVFPTRTLVEIWRTAPYLHDGRAATIHEVIDKHKINNGSGITSQLTEDQINDLVNYVLSL